MESEKVDLLKRKYVNGTKIKLIKLVDPYSVIPQGTMGMVKSVDDLGQIHIAWSNGSNIALIEEIDDFEIVD